MGRIRDLTPDQLARHATNVFVFEGRHEIAARLAYHAVAKDPRHPEALHRLSDLLDQPGTEALSAAVLEYALSLRPDRLLDETRFSSMWAWGFSRHKSGATSLLPGQFADRSQFEVDEERYRAFVGDVVAKAGSLERALRSAHALVGVMGGLLAHSNLGPRATLDEIYHPERFGPTPAYERWLDEDTAKLDELEEKRRRASP
jgi:hypothetical protein